ncbi:hypothetical protein JHK85_040379 [Glycine max]|nr:hypothetical protein JHK85_040379 [Glycine max]
MSSRPLHRGRGRGFSGRPYSGDAHLRSVRDANLGLRRGEGGSFLNQTPHHQNPPYNPRPHPPPPPHHHRPQFRPYPPQFRPPPPQFRPHPMQFRPPPPSDHRPAFRPPQHLRPRPPDYRDWELAWTPPPPPHCERFKVLSYNILADYLALDHRTKLYFHIPRHILDWQWRKRSIIFELGLWSADILCLQEVDRFHELEEELKPKGYSGIWKMRTGNPVDGCAIFWRNSRFSTALLSSGCYFIIIIVEFVFFTSDCFTEFMHMFKLLYEECIEFNKLGLRDNVAQLCVLEFINQNGSLPSRNRNRNLWVSENARLGHNIGELWVTGWLEAEDGLLGLGLFELTFDCIRNLGCLQLFFLTGSSKVVVCNIHVLYNPNRGEIKLGQVRVLLDKAKAVSKLWNDAPVAICGDFNCTPKSPLYNFISEQKLDLSGIDRNKVSGQASATIHASKLYYGPNSSEISANGSVQATSTEGDKEDIEQNNSRLDTRDLDTKCHSLDNQHTQTVSDMSVNSCTNVDCGKESDAYAGKDTQETSVDHSKVSCEVGSIKEPNPSYSEGRIHIDHVNGDIHDITPVTFSAPEEVHSDATWLGSNEHIPNAVPTSNKELLIEESNLHVPEGNKHVEFDCAPTSLQEDDQSSKMRIDLESIDLDNIEISSTKPSSQTSVSCVFEDEDSPSHEEIDNDQNNSSSTSYLVDKLHHLSNITFPPDMKEKSFFDEMDKTIIGGESEDGSRFVSSLHNAGEVAFDLGSSMKSDLEKPYQSEELDSASNNLLLPVESIEMEDYLSPRQISESINSEQATYTPALWTPMEIETATGNADCTFLEHPLQLRSTYTEAMDCSGTRDPHGEPLVTSYNRRFLGTVDYIWRSEGLQTTRVLAPISKHAMQWTPGFPTKKWGSDHIALVTELAFLKDSTDTSNDVK